MTAPSVSDAPTSAKAVAEVAPAWRNAVLYGALGLISYVVFVALTLPGEELGAMVAHRVATAVPGYTVALADAEVTFPATFAARSVTVTDRRTGATMLTLTDVDITPSLWAMLRGHPGGTVTGTVGGGSLRISGSGSMDAGKLSIEADRVGLSAFTAIGQFAGERSRVSGTVEVAYEEPWQSTLSGKVAVKVKDILVTSAAVPSLLVPELRFDLAAFDIDMRDGLLTCTPCELTGPIGRVLVEGTLKLASAFPQSQLDVKIAIEPGPNGPDPILAMLPKDGAGRPAMSLTGSLRVPRIVTK